MNTELSIVIPMKNEAENIARLVRDIAQVCAAEAFEQELVGRADASVGEGVLHLEAEGVQARASVRADQARALFEEFPGLEVLDAPEEARYPVARDAAGRRETFVGRVREDSCLPRTLHFWVVADNLLKGAAWNAVQIAEALHEDELVKTRS